MTTEAAVNPPSALTLPQAAAHFEQLMSAPAENVGGSDDDEKETQDAPEELYGDPQDTTEPVEATADQDTDEEVTDDESEQDTTPRTFRVKVDGAELEVPEDELVKGYSRQADYTKKTQALAEERKRFDAEIHQVQSERQKYAATLGQLEEALVNELPKVDWATLEREQPEEFAKQYASYQLRKSQLEEVRAEREATERKAEETYIHQYRTHVDQERQKLQAIIPEFAHKEKAPALQKQLLQYAMSLGYSAEEVNNVFDHRAIVVLKRAMDGEKILAERKKVAKQGFVSRPALVPGSGVAKKSVSDITKSKQRLAKTGNVRDAAAVFEKLMG